MRRHLLPLLLLLPLLGHAADSGDVVVSNESKSAPARFDSVKKHLDEKKFAEAAAALASIAERDTELMPIGDGRYLQSRLVAQQMLSELPGKHIDDYRRRAEPQGKRLLQNALEEGDPALLIRVVEEAFCTRAAASALDWLGDLAFGRGRFSEAELWWRMLSPLGGKNERDDLVYPDPPEEQKARIQAKQLLARLFANRIGTASDLVAYRRTHPKAEGAIAGRKGLYADILDAIAKERQGRPVEQASDWTTFGGNAARQSLVSGGERFLDRISGLARSGPAWRFDLESRKAIAEADEPTNKPVDAARRLAFHPVAIGDLALVADARYVTAYHLDSGKVETWFDLEDQVPNSKVTLSTPTIPDLRYTLTVADDAVFARLGCQAIRDVRPEGKAKKPIEGGDSVLVSLSLKAKGKRQRWMVKAIDPGRKEFAVFEGAPVVAHERVWIAASRFQGDRVVTAIQCYPAHPEESSPSALWRTDVCQTRELHPAGGEGTKYQRRHRHHLLTLAGLRLVYCSHSGVVVGLDPFTGQQAWALKYPLRDLREPEDEPVLRDLAPCLFADGRIYVAPADSDFLYCLEPITGQVIWRRERLEAVSLLGVGQGKLIFTTHRNPRLGQLHAGGLRAVDAETGSDGSGWQLPDDGGGLIPMGRGLLVGDLVLWSTARKPCGVVAVRQEDGRQADNPALLHRIPSGNLVFANGNFLVTDQRTMWAFVPPDKLPDEGDKAALDDARPLLRRGRAAAMRGDTAKAIEAFDAVLKMADEPERYREEAKRERQWAMLDAAEAALFPKGERRGVRVPVESSPPLRGGGRVGRHSVAGRTATEWRPTFVGERRGVSPPVSDASPARSRRAARLAGTDEAVKWLTLAAKDATGRARLEALVRSAELWTKAGDNTRALAAWRDLSRMDALIEDRAGLPQRVRLVALRQMAALEKKPPQAPSPLEAVSTAVPSIALPVRSSDTIALPDGERFLPLAHGADLSLWAYSNRRELVCRSREGEVTWRSPIAHEPAWLAVVGSVVLAASGSGIDSFDLEKGTHRWHFAAPVRRLWPRSSSGSIFVPRDVIDGELSHFTLAGSHLLFVQDGDTLYALDAVAGEVVWRQRPRNASLQLEPPCGRVHHLFPVDEKRLLVQVAGQRWLCEIATGRLLDVARDAVAAWPQPPFRSKDAVLIVTESRRIERLEPPSLKPRWVYTPAGKSTLTGGLPILVADADQLVSVFPENIGLRLVRLDPVTGKPLWSRQVEGDPDRLAAHAWTLAGDRLLHAEATSLHAWSLADGKPLWTSALPEEGPWRLLRSGSTVLAWPAVTKALAFRFRGLSGSVQWEITPWPGADGVLPLLCIDGSAGELIQRLNLPVDRLGGRVVRPTTGRGWSPSFEAGFALDDGLSVRLDRHGLVFAHARQIRVFENDPRK